MGPLSARMAAWLECMATETSMSCCQAGGWVHYACAVTAQGLLHCGACRVREDCQCRRFQGRLWCSAQLFGELEVFTYVLCLDIIAACLRAACCCHEDDPNRCVSVK